MARLKRLPPLHPETFLRAARKVHSRQVEFSCVAINWYRGQYDAVFNYEDEKWYATLFGFEDSTAVCKWIDLTRGDIPPTDRQVRGLRVLLLCLAAAIAADGGLR